MSTRDRPVRLVITADTHLPRRARDLPGQLWDAVDAADVVLHAGDWVDVDLLDRLEARSERLVACHGNNDGPLLRSRLPEVARAELGGLRFAVVHQTGDRAGRERRCDARFGGVVGRTGPDGDPDSGGTGADGVDVLVFGHSHVPWDTVTPRGTRLLNPGSPTDRRRQPHCTYLTAQVDGGRLVDVVLHRLPPRTTR